MFSSIQFLYAAILVYLQNQELVNIYQIISFITILVKWQNISYTPGSPPTPQCVGPNETTPSWKYFGLNFVENLAECRLCIETFIGIGIKIGEPESPEVPNFSKAF